VGAAMRRADCRRVPEQPRGSTDDRPNPWLLLTIDLSYRKYNSCERVPLMTDQSSAPLSAMSWRRRAPRLGPSLPALAENHPYFDTTCLCGHRLGNGGSVRLAAVGPLADDAPAVQAHNDGRAYEALALVLHEECALAFATQNVDSDEHQDALRTLTDDDVAAFAVLHGLPADVGPALRMIASHVGLSLGNTSRVSSG
jgi:hypothetical protein